MNESHTINGVDKPFLTWCREAGVPPIQVRVLMSQGMPLEKALREKKRRRNLLIHMNGVVKTQAAWCSQYGVSLDTLRRRVAQGMRLQDAFERPVHKRPPRQALPE